MTRTNQVLVESKKKDALEEVRDQFEAGVLVVHRLNQGNLMREGSRWYVRVVWVAMNQSEDPLTRYPKVQNTKRLTQCAEGLKPVVGDMMAAEK